jgi:Flp pilus assembly protein TadG
MRSEGEMILRGRFGTTSPGTSRGQGLVEFALVLPIFLLMLFGLIDGGRYVYLNSVVSQAAREGARLATVEARWIGSTDPSCGTVGGPTCPATVTGAASLQADVAAAANRMVAPFGSVAVGSVFIRCTDPANVPTGAWTGVSCADNSADMVVSVRVVMTFHPLTPGLSGIDTITTSGAAAMVIN